MPDEPATATVPASESPAAAEATPTTEEPFDRDRAMTTIRNLREVERRGEATARERDELKAKLSEIEKAGMTELQKAQARTAELETSHREATEQLRQIGIERAIEREAGRIGIIDADAAARLIDSSKLIFEAGRPTNVSELLTELVAARPYLAPQPGATQTQPPVQSGQGANPARPGQPGSFTRSQIADRAFWTANREAIQAALKAGRIVPG